MPGGDDRPHERGPPLCEPPEHEEGGPGAVPLEEFEQLGHAALGPTLEGGPRRPGHDPLEGRDLEVLLDVDGEVVRDHGGAAASDGTQAAAMASRTRSPAPAGAARRRATACATRRAAAPHPATNRYSGPNARTAVKPTK